SVLFWLGALFLWGSHLAGKNGLKASIGREIQLPDAVWAKLTYMWVGFLIFMGIANWFVFTRFESQWVNYKMFGSTALMLVFFIIQGLYLSTCLKKEDRLWNIL
ncbi:septation protein IspZ, partial [Klebsiella pneumoniae]|nr:septation protein IspZ [Klebsiella pneumoniae]